MTPEDIPNALREEGLAFYNRVIATQECQHCGSDEPVKIATVDLGILGELVIPVCLPCTAGELLLVKLRAVAEEILKRLREGTVPDDLLADLRPHLISRELADILDGHGNRGHGQVRIQ